jgi:hypothetical protein
MKSFDIPLSNKMRVEYNLFYPTFRISFSAESYFGGPLDVLYNLLTIRGDGDARPTHVP